MYRAIESSTDNNIINTGLCDTRLHPDEIIYYASLCVICYKVNPESVECSSEAMDDDVPPVVEAGDDERTIQPNGTHRYTFLIITVSDLTVLNSCTQLLSVRLGEQVM